MSLSTASTRSLTFLFLGFISEKFLAFCIDVLYILGIWERNMATSSIRKNFVISSKKSAVEIAEQLINSETLPLPSSSRSRSSKLLYGDDLLRFLKKAENKSQSKG